QLLTSSPVTGDTTSLHDDWDSNCGGSGNPDAVYFAQLPHLDSLQVSTAGSSFDTVLIMQDRTCGTQIACNDNNPTVCDETSLLIRNNVPAGFYSIVVDGWDKGPYTLSITGVITGGSHCDVPLFASGALSCAPGTTCDGTICKGPDQCDD